MTASRPKGREYSIADPTIKTRKGDGGATRRLSPFRACPRDRDLDESAQRFTPYHQKVSFALKSNVEAFFRAHPLERCLFLTLTFKEDVTAKEASRRLRNLKEGVLRRLFTGWLGVAERTKRNRIHYHLLVAFNTDIRTGFDFDAYLAAAQLAARRDYGPEHRKHTSAYARSASPALRQLWRTFRGVAQVYHFGRIELIPIRTSGDAVSRYVGKYVAKHVGQRLPSDLGAKTFFASEEARKTTTTLAWNSPAAKRWREALGNVATQLGCKTMTALRNGYGSRWAYHLGDLIMRESERLTAQAEAA